MLANIRGWEWLIILAIVLLIFGAKKLPDLAKGVGQSLRVFRSEVRATDDAEQQGAPSATPAPPAPSA